LIWFSYLGVYFSESRYIFSGIIIIISATVALNLRQQNFIVLTQVSSITLMVLLLFAYVAFFVALAGVPPILILDYAGRDDGQLMLHYGSFSNTYLAGRIIRPSSFYDEPGAFAHVIVYVAILRIYLGFDSRNTYILLLLGLITQSLSIVVILMGLVLSEKITVNNFVKVCLLIGCFSLVSLVPKDYNNRDIITRISKFENGLPIGFQGRLAKVEATLQSANDELTLLFGLGPTCVYNTGNCSPPKSQSSDNPLSTLVYFGILYSVVFYVISMSIAFDAAKRKGVLFAVALIIVLLQRPYFASFGYSFLIFSLFKLRKWKISL